MVLASKVAWVGIVFMLLTTGPHPTPLASGANLSKEVPAVGHWNGVKKMQETLRNKGHYETAKGKPSAYIEWAKGSRRTSKILRKAVKTVAAPESGWGDREKTLQAENDNPPQ